MRIESFLKIWGEKGFFFTQILKNVSFTYIIFFRLKKNNLDLLFINNFRIYLLSKNNN